MARTAPPPHYTFVFPRRLREKERNHWRETFKPEQMALYPRLEALDFWEDLAVRLESRPDLVDLLTDGALSVYVRPVLGQTTATGIGRLADAPTLSQTARPLAEHAEQVGATDPNFVYGFGGRQAGAGDAAPADGHMQFSMSHDAWSGLPRYRVEERIGVTITETTAQPAIGAEITNPQPWFADSPEGERLRDQARITLAHGREATIESDQVGLLPGTVPDRFRDFERNGLFRRGRLVIHLSDPLPLSVRFTADGSHFMRTIALYQVPPLPGDEVSYAGVVNGTMLALNLRTRPSTLKLDVGEEQMIGQISIASYSASLPSEDALAGLAFVAALTRADVVRFDCPKLFPSDGVAVDTRPLAGPTQMDVVARGIRIAAALVELSRRDGVDRKMPEAVGPRDFAVAEFVLGLLLNDGCRTRFTGDFEVPLPPSAKPDDRPEDWMRFTTLLSGIADQPTNLTVQHSILNAVPLRIISASGTHVKLACPAAPTGAAMIARVVPHAKDGP
jgi:hypothetical protein